MKNFKLSSVLFGHSLDVRCIVVCKDNSIISGSRDKTAKLWKPNGFNTNYMEVMSYKDQKSFVISVVYLEPSDNFPDGLIITGSNDYCIYIYKPFEPFATATIKEHTNAVSCLARGLSPNTFLSGSWDSNGKYWDLNKFTDKSIITLSGHSAAIWSILQLNDTRILTASADKTIGIWTSEGQRIHSLTGHTDCVRGICDFPDNKQFLSVSNDATIRVWNYNGDNINTYYGHTNFIYSISRCGPDSFVTSDEDRTVKIWQNGVNIQSFTLPAQSVWSVSALSNGDIVTGSSDGVIRIFTQDEKRIADELTLNKFNEEVEALNKQSVQTIGGYKISDLPGKEALYTPGTKVGQIKMIRESQGVIAYSWVADNENGHWEKIGDVLGGTDKDKEDRTVFEGQSYDFVFSVDVEDGKPPLKLPFNKGDNPYDVANKFLLKHDLPSTYLEQVVDFILKNSSSQVHSFNQDYVDPFTGESRYTPVTATSSQNSSGMNVDPFTGGSSYSTTSLKKSISQDYFPLKSYKTFDVGGVNVILSKLKEFNQRIGDCSNGSVEETHLDNLIKICTGPPSDPITFDLLFKLLEWPDDIIFPVLDVVRMAVRFPKNNEIISKADNGYIIRKLLSYINDNKIINNLIVSLRALTNLFVHEHGEKLINDNRFSIYEKITPLTNLNKNAQIALSTLLLNLTLSSCLRADDLGLSVLADIIPNFITKSNDTESLFRSYVALGTLLTITDKNYLNEIKIKIKSNTTFIRVFDMHLEAENDDLEIKRATCVKQVRNFLK